MVDKKFNWFSTYHTLPRIAQGLIPKLHKLCGHRYIDLLLHLPTNVEHIIPREDILECITGETSLLKVTVQNTVAPKNRRAPLKVHTIDKNGNILALIFFNHGGWLQKLYQPNKEMLISGDVTHTLTEAQIVHPNHHSGQDITLHAGTKALYPLTSGVGQKMMQNIQGYLQGIWQEHPLEDWLDQSIITAHNWPSLTQALHTLHHPSSLSDIADNSPAKQRLAFDEFLAWQLALYDARSETKGKNGIIHPPSGELRGHFLTTLPFELTHDQQNAIQDIDHDMSDVSPMLRLVQGDVGSGKTVIALLSLLRAIEHGRQGAMMAPTEVLAEQHLVNAKKWLEPLGITVASLTGKKTAAEKRKIKQALADGEIDLIIGTHALIEDDVIFANLGLVVVDEQHRFGVKQRLALSKNSTPDFLVMTATPIPRTLTLTFYGDMDITIIAEKPPGRTPIETKVLSTERLADIATSLRRVTEKGEQVYWVCPLVNESEKSDLAAATDRAETLKQFYGEDVALLHGKMKAKEKQAVLDAFREGTYKILVSTTVIEVGVDVPNATVMVIEHAERFGLAQLHQLRGRVGRGNLKSSCILLYAPPLSQHGRARLEAMRNSNDGFYLAEKDLEFRGPGETLGTAQSGQFFTKIASLATHKELMPAAKEYAHSHPLTSTKKQTLLRTFGRDHAAENIKAG